MVSVKIVEGDLEILGSNVVRVKIVEDDLEILDYGYVWLWLRSWIVILRSWIVGMCCYGKDRGWRS